MADVTNQFYPGEADIGYGTELLVGQDDGSPETFVAIADVISVKLGKFMANVIDKTHLRSPGRHREKLAGIRDSEVITVKVNWRPTHGSQSNAGGDGFTSGGMLALHRSLAERNFMALVPIQSPPLEWTFRGTVTGFDPPEITVDGKMEATFEITPLRDYSDVLP